MGKELADALTGSTPKYYTTVEEFLEDWLSPYCDTVSRNTKLPKDLDLDELHYRIEERIFNRGSGFQGA